MQICVTKKNSSGKEVSMWIQTTYQALYDYKRHKEGKDIQLARLLFPDATDEEIEFLTSDKEDS